MKPLLIIIGILFFAENASSQSLWLRYPSISPDGKTIVFSHKGDLYSMAATGGLAMPITLHEGYDFMPVWSHDGKQIAFASDRYGNFDIFIMPAEGGEAKRLTFHSGNDLPSDFTPDDKSVIFSSSKMDLYTNIQFPTGALPELYSVPVAGGRIRMEIPTPANVARFNKGGDKLVYEEAKSFENEFRKHQISAFALDLWVYDTKTKSHAKITSFGGDDRNPVFDPASEAVFYLSEESGTLNIHKRPLSESASSTAVTTFAKHPVRNLTVAENGTLCFSWNGEIYTMKEGAQPQKIEAKINTDGRGVTEKIVSINGNASEMAVSPNGKEIAFVFRGEVFVTSVEGAISKRITNTPEQERSVSFSPDGRSLVYAGERNGSWNIYETTIERKEESFFHNSTLLKEQALVASTAEEFQPSYSPDGKEIAYLEERTTLKVYNIASKASRVVLPAKHNYSYSDGDQYYSWSPDSKWFLVDFLPEKHWIGEVGLVNASGNNEVKNLTLSGYQDRGGSWMMNGKMMIWYSDRQGLKSHANGATESDVYGMFFTRDSWDRSLLTKAEFDLLKEKEDKDKEKTEKSEAEKKTDKKGKEKPDAAEKKPDEEKVKDLTFELEGIEHRVSRLTAHSSRLSDAVLSKDGEKLYYLAPFEKGYDLWETKLRGKETKILAKLNGEGGSMTLSKDGKNLFILAGGTVTKVELDGGKEQSVTIKGEMSLNLEAERAYMFEHIWRQVLKKFYVPELHGTDWEFYKKEYARFLPHINNNYDFAEMLSELLGELNASHTGAYYNSSMPNADATAHLGAFYDQTYTGPGLKVVEVLPNGPLDKATSKIKPGVIIEKIDGNTIAPEADYYQLLNRKAGVYTLLSCYDETTKQRFDETVKPMSNGRQTELLYRRWIENRNKETERLSNGRIGYVHVRGMDDESFRDFYSHVLGKHPNKEALIVDTRFNGGGWLHDDLVTFLGGKKYVDFVPRNQNIGFEPQVKWTKASIILMNEGNYSDAHFFPFAYKELELGKLVGSPVPGTATAVWWESLIDETVVFGIPQVGVVDMRGKYLENNQLEPDILIYNGPEEVAKGKDLQLEKAIEELLKDLKK